MTLDRLPGPIRRWLYAAGTRGDRLRDPDAVVEALDVRAELFAGRATEERRIRRLLAPMTDLPVDAAVAERAGRLRRTAQLRLPDALIAATATEHRLTLVTRNMLHFEGVKGLRLRTPA